MQRPDPGYRPTIASMIRTAAKAFADAPFVVTGNDVLTFAEADRRSRALAAAMLANGIGKGTRIGVHFPYGPLWVISFLAAARIGALFMSFSTAAAPAELRKMLKIGDVDTLLAPARMFGGDHETWLERALEGTSSHRPGERLRLPEAPFLRAIWLDGEPRSPWATPLPSAADEVGERLVREAEAEVSPADLLVAIFTSGTTSDPKAVIHTHGAIVRQAEALAGLLDYRQEDLIFAGMPFFWVGGICFTLTPALHAGAALLCMEKVEPEPALDLMEEKKATRIIAWPGMMQRLLASPGVAERDIPALRDPVHSPLLPQFHGYFGMTETCGPYTGAGARERLVPPSEGITSMGPVLPGYELRFVDPDTREDRSPEEGGVVLVRGYGLMDGLYKREREETFLPGGWYETSDQAALRNELFVFTARSSEMIKTSGNNVAPAEVEQALVSMDGVAEAYVLGLPDAQRGEIVFAFVVPEKGIMLDEPALQQGLRALLSAYKVPRRIAFVEADEIPRMPTGKLDRNAMLRQALGDMAAA